MTANGYPGPGYPACERCLAGEPCTHARLADLIIRTQTSPVLAFTAAAVLAVICWATRPRRQHPRPM